MTDTISYVEDLDGIPYQIYGLGLGDLGPVLGYDGRGYGVIPGVEEASVLIAIDGNGDEGQERGYFTVDEYRNGIEVGSANFTMFSAVSTAYDQSHNVIYALGTAEIQITGEFDAFPCFATGTLIATPLGPKSIETLMIGDEVELASGCKSPVQWIGHRRQTNGDVIRICRNALDRNKPNRDLIVSDNHGIFIGGVLIQAGLLVNNESILRERRGEIIFWHLELSEHDIVLAENAPAESYLDTGNRRQFGNCPISYDQSAVVVSHARYERVFAGPQLEAIRRSLTTELV